MLQQILKERRNDIEGSRLTHLQTINALVLQYPPTVGLR